jgi:FtsP/CotA-like multicopper oxidase with cupredoxin domain
MKRRALLKAGVAGGASLVLPSACKSRDPREGERRTGIATARDTEIFTSPPTRPFVMALPIPPQPNEVDAFSNGCTAQTGFAPRRFFRLVEDERPVQVHPDLPPTTIWGYRDAMVPEWPFAVGPLFKARMTPDPVNGMVVRVENRLPTAPRPFGVPFTTVHLHGGHDPSLSDGFPKLDFRPGESFDYCYPLIVPGTITGPITNDVPSTLWYHDHLLDFTRQNVYRGLVGMFLVFDDLDTGDETTGLRLPSGEFDVPLVVQDKSFAPDGSLVYDVFNHDGFLGDKFLMNGAIQPFLVVKRRKYRFRFLDGSNARFYEIFFSLGDGTTLPMDQIATEGGLLSAPLRGIQSFRLAPSTRVEVVVDFSQLREGDEVFFENRLEQVDGRRPGEILPRGPQLLKMIVGEAVDDPSWVPEVLRPFPRVTQAEIDAAVRRSFEFDRDEGSFAINGLLADNLATPAATPRLNMPEIWRLKNKAGGWAHPIHIHLDFMRVLTRNGLLPPPDERDGIARRDTVILGGNDEVEVFLRFRDYTGPFVFHCHNLEHEDMAMMARFDVMSSGRQR